MILRNHLIQWILIAIVFFTLLYLKMKVINLEEKNKLLRKLFIYMHIIFNSLKHTFFDMPGNSLMKNIILLFFILFTYSYFVFCFQMKL